MDSGNDDNRSFRKPDNRGRVKVSAIDLSKGASQEMGTALKAHPLFVAPNMDSPRSNPGTPRGDSADVQRGGADLFFAPESKRPALNTSKNRFSSPLLSRKASKDKEIVEVSSQNAAEGSASPRTEGGEGIKKKLGSKKILDMRDQRIAGASRLPSQETFDSILSTDTTGDVNTPRSPISSPRNVEEITVAAGSQSRLPTIPLISSDKEKRPESVSRVNSIKNFLLSPRGARKQPTSHMSSEAEETSDRTQEAATVPESGEKRQSGFFGRQKSAESNVTPAKKKESQETSEEFQKGGGVSYFEATPVTSKKEPRSLFKKASSDSEPAAVPSSAKKIKEKPPVMTNKVLQQYCNVWMKRLPEIKEMAEDKERADYIRTKVYPKMENVPVDEEFRVDLVKRHVADIRRYTTEDNGFVPKNNAQLSVLLASTLVSEYFNNIGIVLDEMVKSPKEQFRDPRPQTHWDDFPGNVAAWCVYGKKATEITKEEETKEHFLDVRKSAETVRNYLYSNAAIMLALPDKVASAMKATQVTEVAEQSNVAQAHPKLAASLLTSATHQYKKYQEIGGKYKAYVLLTGLEEGTIGNRLKACESLLKQTKKSQDAVMSELRDSHKEMASSLERSVTPPMVGGFTSKKSSYVDLSSLSEEDRRDVMKGRKSSTAVIEDLKKSQQSSQEVLTAIRESSGDSSEVSAEKSDDRRLSLQRQKSSEDLIRLAQKIELRPSSPEESFREMIGTQRLRESSSGSSVEERDNTSVEAKKGSWAETIKDKDLNVVKNPLYGNVAAKQFFK